MRNFLIITVVVLSLGFSFQYMLVGYWTIVFACWLAGGGWLLQMLYRTRRRPVMSVLVYVIAGAAGIFLNQPPAWILTNFVVLLVAWDIDRFERILWQFSSGPSRKKEETALIRAHLIRLGMAAAIGWGLGMVALNVRVPLNFGGALGLGLVMLLSLRWLARLLAAESGSDRDGS